MITLNDYLYRGDTVLKIIKNYSTDLRHAAKKNNNSIDLVHANFLLQMEDLLIHNDFLTSQSQRIREFYKLMAVEYPFLAFTFKGRIKSLIRAESKFNGYIVSYVHRYYKEVRQYYRDYVEHPMKSGYRSLHITFYDNIARSYIEVQLRTKDMDDYAEIGPANHSAYEEEQKRERKMRASVPVGEYIYFDEAYERGMQLQGLDLAKLDVNMFAAANNSMVNDGCGLYRGRLILPYEHLSRFQNDRID